MEYARFLKAAWSKPRKADIARRNALYAACLAKWNLSEAVAQQLAYDCLENWEVNDVSMILSGVSKEDQHLQTLRLVDRSGTIARGQAIRPPLSMVKEAANSKRALCVNKSCEFKLLDSGYMAISHVWSEGLYASSSNQGLPRSVIAWLFKLLEKVQGAEWLWLDSLAVPGGLQELDVETQTIKTSLINSMGKIYRNADAVIVLDALVMQLDTRKGLNIAIGLLFGKWITRMWTFQESRLASTVLVMTKHGPVNFDQILQALRKQPNLKTSSIIAQLQTICNPRKDVTLIELCKACFAREATMDIDYVRAVYPVLPLPWNYKFDQHDAVELIYRSRIDQVPQLAWSWGSPRLRGYPGWAPSQLHGLEIQELKSAKLVPRGLEVPLHQYAISSFTVQDKEPTMAIIEFVQKDAAGKRLKCQVRLSDTESKDKTMHQRLNKTILTGRGMLLAHSSLNPSMFGVQHHQNPIVVLAGKSRGEKDLFEVYLTAKLYEHLGRKVEAVFGPCVLSHNSPLLDATGDQDLAHFFVTSLPRELSVGPKLHEAIKASNLSLVCSLIKSGEDVNAIDSLGWCPLQWAAFHQNQNGLSIAEVLLKNGARTTGGVEESKSAAILAVERGSDALVKFLIRRTEDHLMRGGMTPLAQALYTRRTPSIILHLIDTGADLNLAVHQRPPLSFALDQEESMKLLIDYGANVSARLGGDGSTLLQAAARLGNISALLRLIAYGVQHNDRQLGGEKWTALHTATLHQNIDAVTALLAFQATDPDLQSESGFTALAYAVLKNDKEIVQRLLERGANVAIATFREKRTPLHIAVHNKNYEILNMLLEAPGSEEAIWKRDARNLIPYVEAMSVEGTASGHGPMTLLLRRRMRAVSKRYLAGYAFVYVQIIYTLPAQLILAYKEASMAFHRLRKPYHSNRSLQDIVSPYFWVIFTVTLLSSLHFIRHVPLMYTLRLLSRRAPARWRNTVSNSARVGTVPPKSLRAFFIAYCILPFGVYNVLQQLNAFFHPQWLVLYAANSSPLESVVPKLLLSFLPIYIIFEAFIGYPGLRSIPIGFFALGVIWTNGAWILDAPSWIARSASTFVVSTPEYTTLMFQNADTDMFDMLASAFNIIASLPVMAFLLWLLNVERFFGRTIYSLAVFLVWLAFVYKESVFDAIWSLVWLLFVLVCVSAIVGWVVQRNHVA
jgi:ankyrin repeat protein